MLDQPLDDILNKCREHGIILVSGSLSESEDDLTISEILHIHSLCHEREIKTLAKVELAAPFTGKGDPFLGSVY